jgi:hypothetical protein
VAVLVPPITNRYWVPGTYEVYGPPPPEAAITDTLGRVLALFALWQPLPAQVPVLPALPVRLPKPFEATPLWYDERARAPVESASR